MPFDMPKLIPVLAFDPDELSQLYTVGSERLLFRPVGSNRLIEDGLLRYALEDITYWVGHCKSGMTIESSGDADALFIMFPASGTAQATYGSKSLLASTSAGIIGPSNRFTHYVVSPECRQVGLFISRDAIKRSLSAHAGRPIIGDVIFEPAFDLSSPAGQMLISFAKVYYSGLVSSDLLHDSELLADKVGSALIECVIRSMTHNYSHLFENAAPTGASWQLRRAINYIRANAERPIRVSDIAQAAHLGTRSLSETFRQQLRMTPSTYLRQVRLEKVQQELASGPEDVPIATIARRWGFMHLGHFSGHYRDAFGELPTETRRRKRIRGASR
jgi:AraC-like DNA-binding protein